MGIKRDSDEYEDLVRLLAEIGTFCEKHKIPFLAIVEPEQDQKGMLVANFVCEGASDQMCDLMAQIAEAAPVKTGN